MGKQRALYALKWPEDHKKKSLAGLSVTMRGLSFGDLKKISALQKMKPEDIADPDSKIMDPVIELLSKRIVRWNLTDEENNPIGTDVDSLWDEDFAMLMDIINAWQNATTGISEDLGKESISGERFPEESIPMETS